MKKITFIIACISPLASMAHSGHGIVNDGIMHYLLSPLHLALSVVILILGYGLYKHFRNRVKNHA